MTPEPADALKAEEDVDQSIRSTLTRTVKQFRDDQMTDRAAALTYYGLLSLFPALIAMVSLIGIFGDPQTTTQKITEIASAVGPKSATDTFRAPIESITSDRGPRVFSSLPGSASRSSRRPGTSGPSCGPPT